MTKKSTIIALAAVMFTAGTLGFGGITLAEATASSTTSWKASQDTIKNYLKHAPGVMGTITAINGTTLTVNCKNNALYTVDTSTAKILKNRNTLIAIADLKVGDTIMAQGTLTGTNLVATTVFNGKPIGTMKGQGTFPGIIGTVTAVTGSTFTVTTPQNTIYTVTSTNATITKGTPAVTATLADIAQGDTVMIRGTVEGTNVTATSIFDGKITRGTHGMRGNHTNVRK